jgi:hypothetical protein
LKEFLADSNNSLVIISFLVAHIMGGGATQVVRTAMGVCVCMHAMGKKPNNLHIFKHMQNQCFFCIHIHADFSLWYYVAQEWASYLNEKKKQSSVSHLFNSI